MITVWEKGYEIFLEHEFVVVDTDVELITHVSRTDTGTPRTEGPVTFVLEPSNGDVIRHEEPRPRRAGIYLPTLRFPSTGEWRLRLEIPEGDRVTDVPIGIVRVFENQEAADTADAPDDPDGVSFLKEQQWTLSMRTVAAETKSLVARRTVPARVHAKRGRRVPISSPFAGRLVEGGAEKIVEVGDRVEAGQVLAIVEPSLATTEYVELEVRAAESEAQEIRARQSVELAESRLARTKRLPSTNATATRKVEESEFDLESAKSTLAAAARIRERYREALDVARKGRAAGDSREGDETASRPWELRAPITGVVVRADASPGARVTPADALFVVLDASTVWVEAQIPEHDARGLADAPTAYLELANARDTNVSPLRLDLAHRHTALEVDEASRTVSIFYETRNQDGQLRVGSAVKVFIETRPASDVLSIPISAIVDEDGRDAVFVQVSGETFEKRFPALGVRDRGFVQVLGGISTGERVAATDAWSIRLASLSTAIPAHTH